LSPLQIPAGSTYYFEVRGTVAGVASGYSLTTTVEGDSAYASLASGVMMGLEATIEADSNDDFIWSPNATTTSGVAHIDWANGYQISGLPSSGLSDTLSL
jgi:hypothetical protein